MGNKKSLPLFYIVFWSNSLFTLDDVEKVIRFYFASQILNALVGIYKYFVLGLFSDDFGGGIFGAVVA